MRLPLVATTLATLFRNYLVRDECKPEFSFQFQFEK